MFKKITCWLMAVLLILGLSYVQSIAKMETRQTTTTKQEVKEEKKKHRLLHLLPE